MFAEFEREAHAMVERGEALNAAALNALYKRLVTDYFGVDMVIDDEIKYSGRASRTSTARSTSTSTQPATPPPWLCPRAS